MVAEEKIITGEKMNKAKNIFAKSMLFLSALSLSSAPLTAQTSDCCFPQPCQKSRCCISPCTWCLLGGTLLGAAAGAAAGSAFSNRHGRRGFQGDPGAQGNQGQQGNPGQTGRQGNAGEQGDPFAFPFNDDDTLRVYFNVGLLTTGSVPTTVLITPFVTLPDQTTQEGAQFTITLDPFNQVYGQGLITIPDPFYGAYSIGFRIQQSSGPIVDFGDLHFELIAQIYSDLAGTTPFTTIKVQDSENNFLSLTNPSIYEAQVAGNFTYDDKSIPQF